MSGMFGQAVCPKYPTFRHFSKIVVYTFLKNNIYLKHFFLDQKMCVSNLLCLPHFQTDGKLLFGSADFLFAMCGKQTIACGMPPGVRNHPTNLFNVVCPTTPHTGQFSIFMNSFFRKNIFQNIYFLTQNIWLVNLPRLPHFQTAGKTLLGSADFFL